MFNGHCICCSNLHSDLHPQKENFTFWAMLQPPKTPCQQGLVWDHDLTYSTQSFFCEAAKICKLPRNKRNHPICTCVLQTRLNDTVWLHKSLQVLISGNLCLKVKHFSSSGPVLVTTQLLSVIHSLLPCLVQRKHRKGKTQCVNREDPRSSKALCSHQTSARCSVFEKQAEYILSAQTMRGWAKEQGGSLTKPYRLVKLYFDF